MDRRSAVRNFMLYSAGVIVLPSCLQQDSKASLALKNIQVNAEQEKMMAELTETILPTNDTPGAKGLSSHLFALMMVDDCFKKEEQEKFIKGLQQFDELSKKKMEESFVKATAAQRAAFLKEIENKKDTPEEVLVFYDATKRLTIQSFTGSKYFLTKVRPYEMVPGRFHGSFPAVNSK